MPDYVTALIFIGTFVVAISAAFCAIKIRNMQVARKSLEMQRSVRNLTANLQYGQGALPHIKQV
jgi:cytochrome bd-type quinol oxidase subunit 1